MTILGRAQLLIEVSARAPRRKPSQRGVVNAQLSRFKSPTKASVLARARTFSHSAGSSTTTSSSGVTLNSVFPLLVDHMRQQLRGKGNVQRDFTPAYNHCTPRVADLERNPS